MTAYAGVPDVVVVVVVDGAVAGVGILGWNVREQATMTNSKHPPVLVDVDCRNEENAGETWGCLHCKDCKAYFPSTIFSFWMYLICCIFKYPDEVSANASKRMDKNHLPHSFIV